VFVELVTRCDFTWLKPGSRIFVVSGAVTVLLKHAALSPSAFLVASDNLSG
jgi:hypothetical protein